MKTVKRDLYLSIIICIIFSVLSGFLMYQPMTTFNVVSKILSLVLMIIGSAYLYRFVTTLKETSKDTYDISLVIGIIAILLGVVFLIFEKAIESVLPIILGLFMITNGLSKLIVIKNLKKQQEPTYKLAALMVGLLLLIGLAAIFSFLTEVLSLNQIIAIFLVGYSVINLLLSYLYHLTFKGLDIIVVEAKDE